MLKLNSIDFSNELTNIKKNYFEKNCSNTIFYNSQTQLHDDNKTKNDINNYIKSLNENNILDNFIKYSENGQSLITDILKHDNLSKEEKLENINKIMQLLLNYMKKNNENLYTKDLEANYKKILNFMEKNKYGNYTIKNLDTLFNELIIRYGAAELEKVFIRNNDGTLSKEIDKENIDNNIIGIEDFSKQDLKELYQYCSRPNEKVANGKIDNEIYQGSVGNCWLLASIKALTNNEETLKKLEQLIEVKENGDVIVELKGAKKKYTITKEELQNKKEFSRGDKDVNALDIAIDRYIKEQNLTLKWYQRLARMFNKDKIDPLSTEIGAFGDNTISQAYSILFGEENLNIFYVKINHPNQELIQHLKSGNEVVVTGTLNPKVHEINAKDENGEDYKLITNHAYTIISADENNVILLNPRNTEKKIIVSIKDYLNSFDSYYRYTKN